MRKRFTLKDEASTFTATMDARLLEPSPIVHIDYTDLSTEKIYTLPHMYKYAAWFIVGAAVISASAVLIIYGLSFGMAKTYMWIAACLTSFLFATALLDPIRIVFVAAINAFLFRKNIVIEKRKINPALVSNPVNPLKKQQMLKLRQYNSKLYKPTPFRKLQTRLDDIKYNLEMKGVLMDLILFAGLCLFASFAVTLHASEFAFYNNDAAKETFLNGRYTHSPNLSSVRTYDELMIYLNETLLPALFPTPTNDTEGNKTDRRKRSRSWDFNARQTQSPPGNVRKRQILDNFDKVEDQETDIVNGSWTINPNLKLIGKARFRQVRVKTDNCVELREVEARNVECAPELNILNVETRDFSLNWDRRPPSGLTDKEESPWKYRSASDTETLPIFTKGFMYPGGGYVQDLPKNIDDARNVLEFLDTFGWLDMRTRALLIEFTVYCVNTNVFNVVTIIAGRSATGYFIPSYQIETCVLVFAVNAIGMLIIACIFSILTLFFVLIETVRIYRTSLKMYLFRAFSVVDISLMISSILCIIFLSLEYYHTVSVVNRLESFEKNSFVSFSSVAFWNFCSCLAGGVCIFLVFFKLLRLSSYQVVFYQVQNTLTECYKHFVDLIIRKFILIIAFAFVLNLTLLNDYDGFSYFGISLLTLLCRTFGSNKALDAVIVSSSLFITPVFLFLFLMFISILLVNIFIAVICLYYHKVREIPLMGKYQFFEYIKYCLIFWRQKDVAKYTVGPVVERMVQSTALRLRGGGGSMSRKCSEREACDLDGDEPLKVPLRDFVIKKQYDTTAYVDLSVDRVAALKYLTIYHLSADAKVRTVFSDFALRALFCALTTEPTAYEGQPADYFFVVKKSGKEVFDKRIFPEMQKVVEEYGKENGYVIKEDTCVPEIGVGKKLDALEQRLCRLVKKSDPKQETLSSNNVS